LKLLVDTHAALWLLLDDARLPASARRLLFDEENECVLSAATVWEAAIKRGLGKLKAPADFHVQMQRHGFTGLPVYDHHAARVANLTPHHRDPFDRLLVAQAMAEGMSILSDDAQIRAYDVPVLW
jgi:PIN domain nuclease of toxin-antitoxin system